MTDGKSSGTCGTLTSPKVLKQSWAWRHLAIKSYGFSILLLVVTGVCARLSSHELFYTIHLYDTQITVLGIATLGGMIALRSFLTKRTLSVQAINLLAILLTTLFSITSGLGTGLDLAKLTEENDLIAKPFVYGMLYSFVCYSVLCLYGLLKHDKIKKSYIFLFSFIISSCLASCFYLFAGIAFATPLFVMLSASLSCILSSVYFLFIQNSLAYAQFQYTPSVVVMNSIISIFPK